MSRVTRSANRVKIPRSGTSPPHPQPSIEPTEAQAAWLVEVRDLLDHAATLECDGRRLRQARLDAPEAVALRYLVQDLRRTLELAELARAEGRPLELIRVNAPACGDSLPALRLGTRPARVLRLDDYRTRREAGDHG